MDTREVLIAARALIAKGWTQGYLARDERGLVTRPSGDEAVCWCCIGALSAVAKCGPIWSAVDALSGAVGGAGQIARWNDAPKRTQAEVLEAFDRAIAACEAQS